jgi:hypothetical protein
MRPENEARLRKIRLVSSILRGVCKLVLGLIVLEGVRIEQKILFPGKVLLGVYGTLGFWFPVAPLTARGRVVVGLLAAVMVAIIFKCVYHLHRLLGYYARGEVFTGDSVWQLRQWGWMCALWGVMKITWPLIERAIALHQPSALGTIVLHQPSALVFPGDMVVTGLGIVAISWFMEMAAEMREENELTV